MSQNMEYENNCKTCSRSVRITPEEIAALFDSSLRIKQVKVVTEEEYAQRLVICRACPALINGTTCQHCGCLVKLKAKLKASKCPFPYAPKWPQLSGALETKQPEQT